MRFADLILFSNDNRRFNDIRLARLVNNCDTPIIVINERTTIPFSKFICFYDARTKSQTPLSISKYLVKYWKLDPLVVIIQTKRFEIGRMGDKSDQDFTDFGINPFIIEVDRFNEIPPAILENLEDSDLIILGRRKTNFIRQTISESIFDSLTKQKKQPILYC